MQTKETEGAEYNLINYNALTKLKPTILKEHQWPNYSVKFMIYIGKKSLKQTYHWIYNYPYWWH
jgi:hypothetical protein